LKNYVRSQTARSTLTLLMISTGLFAQDVIINLIPTNDVESQTVTMDSYTD
jgi:hypothetical protein